MQKNKEKGSVLIGITVVSVLALLLANSITGLIMSRSGRAHKAGHALALNSATRSSFAILESALRRRLWEVPLNSGCMKAEKFSVEIRPLDGMVVNVVGEKDPDRGIIKMVAKGTFRDQEVQFFKVLKISDISEFLLFSKGDTPIEISRSYGVIDPAGIIAGPKRVYSEGILNFKMSQRRSSYAQNWVDPTVMDKEELGLILQADRIMLSGGLRYQPYTLMDPNPISVNAYTMIHPLFTTHGGGLRAAGGAGVALVMDDYAEAKNLFDKIKEKNLAALPPVSYYQKYIYPHALFCGTPPLYGPTATDEGCFHNDVEKNFVARYTYGSSGYGTRRNVTCVGKNNSSQQQCSNSNDFPKGFEKWKASADLGKTLYGEESQKIDFPVINWDNMEALREEAQVCGVVLTVPEVSAYEDCDLANQDYLGKYLSSGGTEPCMKMSSVSFSSLSSRLANFDLSAYANVANKGRYGRRVIYSKVPLEVRQDNEEGLWASLPNATVRNNIPFWFVGEGHFRLKPFQADTTSPLDSDPDRIRNMYFNGAAATSGPLDPLKLVMVTPEKVEIVSPFHQPYSLADMNLLYPVSGGKIKPRQYGYTDYQHQENDAFRYGMRNVFLENMAIITNPGGMFSLRGLWSTIDGSAQKYYRNGCLMDLPGDGSPIELKWQDAPAYAGIPNPMVPPTGSSFYRAGTPPTVSNLFVPESFRVQHSALSGAFQSQITYKGMRMHVGFEDKDVGGVNLAKPKRKVSSYSSFKSSKLDVSDRYFVWTGSKYIEPTGPAGVRCDQARALGSLTLFSFRMPVSDGRYSLTHQNSDSQFEDLGAVFAQPLMNIKEL